jgi:hypothetical protein
MGKNKIGIMQIKFERMFMRETIILIMDEGGS